MWPNTSTLQTLIHLLSVVAVSHGSVLTYRMPRMGTGPPAIPRPLDKVSDFRCVKEGSFPVPGSRENYYRCDRLPNFGLNATLISCPPGSNFDDFLKTCNLVTTRPDSVSKAAEEIDTKLDNINQITEYVAVQNSPPLQRQKRFLGLMFLCLIICDGRHNEVDLSKIEHRLDGINGRLKDVDSSILKSQIENAVDSKITQNLIQKGIKANQVNFQLTQDLIEQSLLESRINAAFTQGLIIQGNIASEMNFEKVQGSIGEVRTFIDQKMNEAKSDMELGFQSIASEINRARTEPLVSEILTFIKGYDKRIRHLLTLSEESQLDEITKNEGYIDYLESSTLEDSLRAVIHQDFAIPTNETDVSSVPILDLLVEGFRIHITMLTSIISSYIFLAEKALKDRNLDEFDTYMKRAISSTSRMNLNLGYDADSGLNKDIGQVLEKVQKLNYASQIPGLTQLISEKQSKLKQIETSVKEFNAMNSYLKKPGSMPKKLDFTKSSIPLPMGPWRNGAQVQYAFQLSSSEGMSEIGDWSRSYTVFNRANPVVHLPSAGEGVTQLVYRKFDGQTPELVAIITDREQSSFRDIGRDMLNAASRPNEELAVSEIQALLDDGADINIMLENEMMPLHYAAKYGNVEVMKILLSKGADLHAKASDDQDALHFAALHDHRGVIECLISKGSLVDTPTKYLGWTPLHVAAVNDYGDATRALIMHNASINIKDSSGLTPLHLSTLGNGEAMAVLLEENQLDVNTKASDGQTPLHYSAKSSNAHITKKLLDHSKIDINSYTDSLLSPLHYAAMTGSVDTVGSLMRKGASPFIFDKDGSSPLHYAAFYGNEEAVSRLLGEDQLVESAKNWKKRSAFNLAVEARKTAIISVLRNESEFLNDEFEKEYLNDTGISLVDIDCTHGMAQEMATGSEETCIHVGHITNYIDVLMSKQFLPVHDAHGEFIQIINDYNNALQKAKLNVLSWKQGDSIFLSIQQTFIVTKEFEAAFEKKYKTKQRQLENASQNTAANKLKELVTFLEQVKNDVSEIVQTAMNAKQKCTTFHDVVEKDIELITKSNHDAKELFKNLQNQHVGRNAVLKYFLQRQEQLENVIVTEKQHIPSTFNDIYESYKGLRAIKMQLVQKIEHVPTQRFATTISSPLSSVICKPLLTLKSPSEEKQIRTLKNTIDQDRVKVQTLEIQVKGKVKLFDGYQTLIFAGIGNLEDLEKAHATFTKLDCNLQDMKEIVPSVQSSFAGAIASLEKIESAFNIITRAISDMISTGKAAVSVQEKENALSSINEGLSKLRCHWKDTGVKVADLKECSKNFYFIYPKTQLIHTQC